MFLKLVTNLKHHLKPVKPSILLILILCLLNTNLFLMSERFLSPLVNGLFLTANSEIGHKPEIGIKSEMAYGKKSPYWGLFWFKH